MPVFQFSEFNIESRADSDALVEAAEQVDDDFTAAVIIDDLEFADVTTLHHNLEKLNNNLAAWADEDLALAAAFCICDCFESISKNRGSNHEKGTAKPLRTFIKRLILICLR